MHFGTPETYIHTTSALISTKKLSAGNAIAVRQQNRLREDRQIPCKSEYAMGTPNLHNQF